MDREQLPRIIDSPLIKDLAVHDDERQVALIKRSIFPAIFIVLIGVVIEVLLAYALVITLAGSVMALDASQQSSLVSFFLFFMAFVALGVYIAVHVYFGTMMIVTEEQLLYLYQRAPFSAKRSQLNLAEVQDIAVDTAGPLPSLFGYGLIEVQTAGTAENFGMSYANRPNAYKRTILDLAEAMKKSLV